MSNPTPIDELSIEIDAKAKNANSAIDGLCEKLDSLITSISKVDVGKLNNLASGIQRLGAATKEIQSIDKRAFTSVATKIKELSAIDTSKFATVSANLHQMANGIQSLGTVSANVSSVGELAKNIGKLGNKSVQTAVTNIPQLATALNGLMTTLSHAPKVSQNVIQMTNALANLSAQGSKVGSASNSIVKGLNKASTSAIKAKGSFKGLASALGKFYTNCFLAIRGIKSLWNSINSTADYLEAFNYFEVALNKVGGDWASDWEKYSEKLGVTSAEEYANSFKTRLNESLSGLSGIQISVDTNGETGLLTDTGMKNLGLNIQEVTQYASQLSSVTNSIGLTGEATLATASAFTKLGADMSSLFNTDYSTVMNNLQSGLMGQSRAMYKYGSDTTVASLQTLAYSLNIEKAVSEMTQMEKTQLRIIKILQDTKVAWGDQANTINSLSNSIRQFKNNISEAGQILGQLFVPIMSKIMPIVNGATIAIKRLMVSIAGLMGIKLDLSEFGQGTGDITDDMDGLSDSLENIVASAEKAKNSLMGFDEINKLQDTDSSTNLNSSINNSLDLTDEITKATEEYEKAWQEAYDRMENQAIALADRIEKALEPIKKIFQDFAIGDYFQAGQDVSDLVVSINNFVTKAIESVDWEKIGTNIGKFLAGIDWKNVLLSLLDVINAAVKATLDVWVSLFDEAPFETALITIIGLCKFTKLGKFLGSKIIGSITIDGETATIASLGTKIAGVLGKSISAAIIGWNIGQWVYEAFTDEKITMTFAEQMKYLFNAFFNDDNEVKNKTSPLVNDVQNLLNYINDFSKIDFNKITNDYYKLSQKTIFTDEDLEKLSEYKELLEQYGIDVSGYIDKVTNAWKGTENEIDQVIEKTKKATLTNMFKSLSDSQKKVNDKIEELKDGLGDAYNYFESLDQNTLDRIFDLASKKDWSGIQNITGLYIGDEEIQAYKYILKLQNQSKEITSKMSKINREYMDSFFDDTVTLADLNQRQNSQLAITENSLKYIDMLVTNTKNNVENTPSFDINTATLNEKINESQQKINNLTKSKTSTVNFSTNINSISSLITMKKNDINNSVSQVKNKFDFYLADTSTFNSKLNSFVNNTNNTLGKINTKVQITAPTLANSSSLANSLLTGLGIKAATSQTLFEIKGYKGYSSGGFPEDGWFRASKGEYFGQFDDGTSYIANNNQITTGIAVGVEEAAYRGISRAMAEYQNETSVNITLQGDVKKLFKAVQNEANNYVVQTGKAAFNF